MAQAEKISGPASLLAPKQSWLSDNPEFVILGEDDVLTTAARMMHKITRAMRARQGELGVSTIDLAADARVRRQTVSAVLMGKSWPDSVSLTRICVALDLDLIAQLPEMYKSR